MATMRRAQGLWSKTSAIDRSDCTDPGEMTSPQGKDVELERAKIDIARSCRDYSHGHEDVGTHIDIF